LEVQESGRLMRLVKELNAKSRVKVDRRDAAAEMSGGNVVGLTTSPPTSPGQGIARNRQNCPGSRGRYYVETSFEFSLTGIRSRKRELHRWLALTVSPV